MSTTNLHEFYKPSQGPVLVTGATGNVGRQVVSQLLAMGARVRALTRKPASAELPQAVEIMHGDFSDPQSLPESLAGVGSVFLVWRGLPVAAAGGVVDWIAKHARRVVFLSSSAVRDDLERQTNPIGQIHADVESLIHKSGLEWTFLRPGGFATNSLMWWGAQIRAGDVVRWPYGAAAMAPIHESDIAAVAVRALTGTGHSGSRLVLTGPELLTQADQVRLIGEVIGRRLRFEELPLESARQQMMAFMPAPIVDMLLASLSSLVTDPPPITNTVRELTGVEARTFLEWVKDHAKDFRLNSPDAAIAAYHPHNGSRREATVNTGSRLPAITRQDAGTAVMSEWAVSAPERQQALVDAIVASWEGAPWPPGLLSVNVLASSDGDRVLSYAQWASDEAYREFAHGSSQRRVDRSQPGIGPHQPIAFHLYRSKTRADAPVPGCVVIVSVEFDGPNEARQRRWVDTVFEALEAESELHPGGISGHFHLSTDGRRVMNYAEWVDEESHREALARSGKDSVGSGPKFDEVRNFSGVVSLGYKRYKMVRSLSHSEGAPTSSLTHA